MISFRVTVLFCLSLVAISYTSAQDDSVLLGPTFCAQGPTVWCSNFTTAIQCTAVKHCLQAVWLTHQPPKVVGSCGSCEAEIRNIRQSISGNTTKEVIQELLENICSLNFITELFRKRCEKYIDDYVDTYFNELLDLLTSDIDPATVCHILGFCSSIDYSALNFDNDAAVRYENIILHLPADFVDIDASQKLVGSEKCTWGPSYWCHNLTSSKECKSTSHCIRSVWSKEQYTDDDDSVCKVCKDMVQQARDQLQSNETQDELRQVFEGSCKLIPIREVRQECLKLADEFVPELTEMLVSEMNPTVICTVAGLCNNVYIDTLLTKVILNPADSCTNCTAALTAVQRFLQVTPQSNVLNKLLPLCNQLSSFSDKCVDMIVANFNHIYDMLMTEMRPFPICHLSGMCTQQYHQHSISNETALKARVDAMLATTNDDLPCDLCKQLVKHLKDVLTTNTTENEFLDILHGICQHTKSFKDDCLEIVDKNYQRIYKFLTEELNPTEVCHDVNLCPTKNMVSDENLHLINHYTPTDIRISGPVKTAECQFCRMILSYIQKEIEKPEYEHNIEKLLNKVCSLVPHREKDKCDQFIQQYADTLIKLLASQTDPGIVCKIIDLCPDTPAVGGELCPICQYVLHFIEEELQKPEEQQKLEEVVRKVCRYMPKSEQQECQSFITDYASLIISVLSQEIDPSMVCPALKLCPQQLSPFVSCIQCQNLIDGMIKALNNDHTEPKVMAALQTFVPSKGDDSILTAIQIKVNHHDDIIDMMSAEFDAQESCVYMQFCNAQMISSKPNLVEKLEETNNIIEMQETLTKPSCELCELMVQLYVDKLTSNVSEAEIEADLQKVCDKIKTPSFRSNCTHFVQKYVPQVVKLLKKDVSPQEVCSLVKLCPPKFDLVSVGSEHCEFCEAIVGSLEGLSSDPVKVTKSIKYLFAICNVFPRPNEHANCMKVISSVGPQLESLALGIPSWYYCTKIHMCPYGAHLSYKQVCKDQSQWCSDVTKAMLCNQLDYCQQSVWMSDKPSL